MKKNVFAYTAPGASYPGYVSINRTEGGDYEVTVRAAPTVRDGGYICGFARQKGEIGRCTPGDERCNNYCNMAPEKGPMQDHPAPCTQVFCGETVSYTVPADEWPEAWGQV